MGLAQHIQAYQSFVNFVGALSHVSGVLHIVSLPVTQLRVAACLIEVGRLTDDQLTHFVNEVGLSTRKQSEHRSGLQALTD